MTASAPSDPTFERIVEAFLETMAAAGNPGLSTARTTAGRRAVWRFSIHVWGEYGLEPTGKWWHANATPPDYGLRWQQVPQADVACAVAISELRDVAAQNGISLRRGE